MSRATNLLGVVVLIVAVWLTGYQGRHALVDSQRNGCERGRLDRAANARAWREAEKARRADRDYGTARVYAQVATGLETRARIDCSDAFPSPSLLPTFLP
jgi:hypothetical protein